MHSGKRLLLVQWSVVCLICCLFYERTRLPQQKVLLCERYYLWIASCGLRYTGLLGGLFGVEETNPGGKLSLPYVVGSGSTFDSTVGGHLHLFTHL